MSRIDDLVTAIAARYNDSTVSFEAGKLRLNEHAQQRKVIFVRQNGSLQFSTAPGRRPFGTPVSGAGTFTQQRFTREEQLEVTLRAADEEDLDDMFDRFVNTVFEVCGPNAFENANQYEWFKEDSKNGGSWETRNPAIKLYFNARLASRSQTSPYAVVASTDTDVTEGDETVNVIVPAP